MLQDNSVWRQNPERLVLLAWLLGGVLFLLWQANRPLYRVDQFNLGDPDVVAEVLPGTTLRQTVTPTASQVDRLYLRTTSIVEPQVRLVLSQGEAELYQAEQSLQLALAVDQQRVEDPEGRAFPGAWLVVELPGIPVAAGEPLSMTLTPLGAPLQLAWQKDTAAYPPGRLQLGGEARPGSLGFATLQRQPALAALQRGLLAEHQFFWLVAWSWLAVAAGVGVGALRRRRVSLPLVALLLALTYTLPLYQNMTAGGVWDWPEAAAAYQSATHSLAAGQFPGWNPYLCGGVPSWADPQPYWPSVTFLLTLAAGLVVGSKLATTLYLGFGVLGMALLAQRSGVSRAGSLLSAGLFMFSGFVAAHLVAGQMLWLTMAYVPWVLYCFLRTEDSRWWLVPSALAFVAILFEGRVYLNAYVVVWLPLFAAGLAWQRRQVAPLSTLGLWGLVAAGLAAVKLLPTLAFSQQLAGSLREETGIPWSRLLEVLTTRNVELMSYQPDWLPLTWHEVAAYLGWAGVLLALLGSSLVVRRKHALGLTLLAGVLLFTSIATAQVAEHNILEYFPLAKELHNPGRAISMVLLGLAVLAGVGADWLASLVRRRRLASLLLSLLAIVVFADLATMAAGPLAALYSQPLREYRSHEQFRQVSGHADNGLHIVTAGYGAVNYCPPHAREWRKGAAIAREGGQFVSTERGTAAVHWLGFSPNQVRLALGAVTAADRVILNQKFADGWHSQVPVSSADGRLAVAVTPDQAHRELVVRYRVPYLRLGAGISAATIVLLAGLYWRHGKT